MGVTSLTYLCAILIALGLSSISRDLRLVVVSGLFLANWITTQALGNSASPVWDDAVVGFFNIAVMFFFLFRTPGERQRGMFHPLWLFVPLLGEVALAGLVYPFLAGLTKYLMIQLVFASQIASVIWVAVARIRGRLRHF